MVYHRNQLIIVEFTGKKDNYIYIYSPNYSCGSFHFSDVWAHAIPIDSNNFEQTIWAPHGKSTLHPAALQSKDRDSREHELVSACQQVSGSPLDRRHVGETSASEDTQLRLIYEYFASANYNRNHHTSSRLRILQWEKLDTGLQARGKHGQSIGLFNHQLD